MFRYSLKFQGYSQDLSQWWGNTSALMDVHSLHCPSIHASICPSIMCFVFSSSSVHQLLQLIDPCCWEITIPLLHVQYSCPLTHSCPGFNSPFNESTYAGEAEVIASTESPSHVLPPDPGMRSSTCSGPPAHRSFTAGRILHRT